ncbi:MAG: GyrI-like domain-containing protein, partial [Chloroflexi bacterium]|nr:GyrI-like domain-containing protein [Chloroflexota bacterium]
LGPYDEVAPAIEKLHQFVRAAGYEIAGYHEEEYLSRPDARAPKTMIRYQVKKV